MRISDLSDIIVALATPPGVGAIGVIRLSGPNAIALTDGIFKGKVLALQASHTAHFGRIESPDGRVIDEVLVTIFHENKSYTGQETVEISCHGSPFVQQRVIELCLESGARLAEPGEYTLRAFLNGKLDLSQAEAVADLIASETEAAHAVALNQLRGGFKKEIQALREELIHFASLVELELDFGEEDVEFADRADLKALVHKIREHLRPLIASFALGNALKTGVTTVIAGRPNAGKSTLLNALLNEERAIVSEIPGTTRDTIEEVLNIKGVQFRLVDTAGIREAQDAIEVIGVQRTMEKIGQAAIVVYVWDVSVTTIPEVYADVAQLPVSNAPLIIVCNKMDRNPLFDTAWLLDPTLPEIHPYLLKAESGMGNAESGMGNAEFGMRNSDSAEPQKDSGAGHSTFRTPHSAFRIPDSAFHIPDSAFLIPVSAKNQMNIEYLKEKFFETVVGGDEGLMPSLEGAVIVSNARHHDALRRADAALVEVLDGLDSGITGDFVAQDIRRSLSYLGEISGEIGVEDLLGNIFGKFCIGK